MDGNTEISQSRGHRERHRSWGRIRSPRHEDSETRTRPIPLPPVVPNVNVITPTDTGSTLATGETVIHTGRRLPPTPSNIQLGTSDTTHHPGEPWKHSGRAERPISFEMAIKGRDSSSSDSTTDHSKDRSMPYYEVPSSSLPYNHRRNAPSQKITSSGFSPPIESSSIRGDSQNIVTHVTFSPPPPPVATTLNVPISSSDGRPYSLIDRSGQGHSRLI